DHATVLENGVSVLSGAAASLRQREDVRAFYLGQKAPPAASPSHLHAVV
ncbi:ABC transporter ATP-binding protein, partial [Mesorhizobium sp. M2D.F.Ca.ET.223.01.1.1]